MERLDEILERGFYVLYPDGHHTKIDSGLSQEILKGLDPALIKVLSVTLHEKSFANHTKILQQMEWLDYEPASDKGNFRFYPKGAMIYNLLAEWIDRIALNRFGSLPVRTPLLYQWGREDIQGQAGIFFDRMYQATGPDSEEMFVLRFDDDAGLFQIIRDARLTYAHLPVRMHENSICFRYSMSGELSGIRRARSFSLCDMHSFCADFEQGMREYVALYKHHSEIAKALGIKLVMHFKTSQDLFLEMRSSILEMVKLENGPVILEILPGQRQYWTMKHTTYTHHPYKIFHVQLDLEDAKRYGITYINSSGAKSDCVIVHSSLGSVERWILIALEEALMKNPPVLPLWLSPTQVRILPVSEKKHLDFSFNLAEEIKRNKIRVDIDERPNSLAWRIRAAEREWVPYIIVCGDKEVQGEPLTVRKRGLGQEKMQNRVLIDEISQQTKDMPFRNLPELLISKRPVFRGRD